MMTTKLVVRYYVKVFLKIFLYILRVLPIKQNKIVFESFGGWQVSCNPYYIYSFLHKEYPQLDLNWCIVPHLCNERNLLQEGKNMRPYSFSYFVSLMTCKVYITNDVVPYYVPFRKQQIVINTWHGGGAYKKVGSQLDNISIVQKKIVHHIANSTTYFLSSSKTFTEIMSQSMGVEKRRFLEVGMPRNDCFFDNKQVGLYSQKVRQFLHIKTDEYVVLYAPTFRNTPVNPSFDFMLDVNGLKESIRKRFGSKKVVFLFRGHHSFNHFLNSKSVGDKMLVNVSDYPLMQELLCCADMLISDYSSCIWDYSYTYRPCILFTPDLKEYENERDFYAPIKEWGFPVAETNKQLCEIVELFNEKDFHLSIEKHHSVLQSYEKGWATQKIVKLILSEMQRN